MRTIVIELLCNNVVIRTPDKTLFIFVEVRFWRVFWRM